MVHRRRAAADRRVRTPPGPVATTCKSLFDKVGVLGAWAEEQPLDIAQTDATAAIVGDYVWLYGGSDANGPVALVQRGAFGQAAAAGLPANPEAGKVIRWASTPANLPVARAERAGWARQRGDLPRRRQRRDGAAERGLLGGPDQRRHDRRSGSTCVSDLPVPAQGGAPVVSGPDAIIVGGTTDAGVVKTSVRANTAPQAPFFQLGLVGATVPGLTIEGEIGQQLGYLNAAGVGTLDFILLILIGWAFAHKAQLAGADRQGPPPALTVSRRRAAVGRRRRRGRQTSAGELALARPRPVRDGPAARHAPRRPCRPPR